MPNQRWNDAGELLAAQDLDRTQAINAFFAWLLREPGARLPERAPKAGSTQPAPAPETEPAPAETS
jgi:hypothetical protein